MILQPPLKTILFLFKTRKERDVASPTSVGRGPVIEERSLKTSELGTGLEIEGSVMLGDVQAPNPDFQLKVNGTDGDDKVIVAGSLQGFSEDNPVEVSTGEGDDTVIIGPGAETIVTDPDTEQTYSNNGNSGLDKTKEPVVLKVNLGVEDGDNIVQNKSLPGGSSYGLKLKLNGLNHTYN